MHDISDASEYGPYGVKRIRLLGRITRQFCLQPRSYFQAEYLEIKHYYNCLNIGHGIKNGGHCCKLEKVYWHARGYISTEFRC